MAEKTHQSSLAQDVKPARKRPDHVSAPEHWKTDKAPEPEAMNDADKDIHEQGPTRYGDWESKGMAIDF